MILFKLKKLIVKFDKIILKDESISFLIIELKAAIYQSFSKMVKLNKALTSTVAEILIEQVNLKTYYLLIFSYSFLML